MGSVIDNEDLTNEFVEQGYWEHGFNDKYHDDVRSMEVGDLIAIKATYTRKKGLPFETFENTTSVMSIKATGVIEENPGDGKKIYVSWEKVQPIREWYFYTYRPTIWAVQPGEWMNDELIDFTFNISIFRDSPSLSLSSITDLKFLTNLSSINLTISSKSPFTKLSMTI